MTLFYECLRFGLLQGLHPHKSIQGYKVSTEQFPARETKQRLLFGQIQLSLKPMNESQVQDVKRIYQMKRAKEMKRVQEMEDRQEMKGRGILKSIVVNYT